MNVPIKVGLVTEAFFDLPFWCGVDHGGFAAAGLDVEVAVLGGIDAVTAALLAGEIQFGVGSPEHVVQDVENGGPLRMVAGNVNRLTHSLIVQPDITRLEDLRGRTIGVSALSAGTSSLFLKILTDVGLSPGDYNVVEAGPVPPRHSRLLSGEIDAAMQTDPHNYLAEDAGLGNLGPVLDWVPYFQFVSVNVDSNWAHAHREVVTAFLRVAIEASDWVYRDRTGAIELARTYMNLNKGYLDRAWHDHATTGALPRDLRLLRPSVQTMIDMMRQDRTAQVLIEPHSKPDKYIDGTYLEQAQRELKLSAAVLV